MNCSKYQPDEDEALLLAALGSTTASASAYEHSVLRDAQLRSAPQIVLPHSTFATGISNDPIHTSSSLVPCGEDRLTLPDLSSLAPSTSRKKKGAMAADVPHVLTLLSRTRDLLRSAKAISGASHGGGVAEEDEQRRRRKIDHLSMKEQILLGYLTDVAGLKEDDAVIPQKNVVHGRKRQRANNSDAGDDYYGNATCSDTFGETLSDASIRGSKIHGKQEKSGVHTSSTNRLDRIKNGEQFESSQKRPLKHNSMMSMKSHMRVESGMSPLKTMDEVQFDEEKSRKRREDRRKRRLKRQRAAMGIVCTSDEEFEFEATPENITGIMKNTTDGMKVEITDEEKKSENNEVPNFHSRDENTEKSGVRWASANESPNFTRRTHTKVFCPVCQVILIVDHSEEGYSPDDFLAKHIAECQQVNRMRNGGRTLRKRSKLSPISLDKSEASDDDLQVNYEETDVGKKSPPVSVDDMDEFDYEERVDDWIERGLEQMGDMAERDCSERPPGARIYEGGLHIPAWVNDRLFPYQRTGVRWMWELHCQGAGGVGK